jgi:hypothetical protein
MRAEERRSIQAHPAHVNPTRGPAYDPLQAYTGSCGYCGHPASPRLYISFPRRAPVDLPSGAAAASAPVAPAATPWVRIVVCPFALRHRRPPQTSPRHPTGASPAPPVRTSSPGGPGLPFACISRSTASADSPHPLPAARRIADAPTPPDPHHDAPTRTPPKPTFPIFNRKGGLCGRHIPLFYTFSTTVDFSVENLGSPLQTAVLPTRKTRPTEAPVRPKHCTFRTSHAADAVEKASARRYNDGDLSARVPPYVGEARIRPYDH